MNGTMDLDALRGAMAENAAQPEGPSRGARAEQLLVEAEKLGVPLAVIEALGHQLQMYNYSSEKDKMFVPFARLLRMWDERPEDFDAYETHSLHWVFKWMSGGMLHQPHIPLASIEKWLGEMEHRYRVAGHSERAVRMSEFYVADHIGDEERATRAYDAWLAADRDDMADCHACELNGQGERQSDLLRDERALELWQPVLEGEFSCAHEPHATLATSLIPLLRLGRPEEARANHLRGYRLVRSMESMRGAFASHVEFCALTGNAARALELLAERPAYFTDSGNPQGLMDFLGVTALVMDRLVALGMGEQEVPGPAGRAWTASELAVHARGEALSIAARFDERNGTARVGTRIRQRMDQPPLLERLPLGVRVVRTAVPSKPVVAAPAEPAEDATALVAEARRLSATEGGPDAAVAWRTAERAAESEGLELTVHDRAEIADYAAMDAGDAPDLFARAAELYEAAGVPDEARAARARGAYALSRAGRNDEAVAAVQEPYEQVLATLKDLDATTARPAAAVLACRARILLAAHSGDADAAAAEECVRQLLALTEPYGDVPRLASQAASARSMLGDIAVHRGDTETAVALYEEAAATHVAAGRPWLAVDCSVRLAGLARERDDLAGAEQALRAALEHGAGYMDPYGAARLHLQLADVLAATEQFGQASAHALEAAHWADEAGGDTGLGAWARFQLGGHLLREERVAEAAEVLESALLDLTEEDHGDGALVQALWWLGDCARALGEHLQSAEAWLKAAEYAQHWSEQRDHAMLANLAADALDRAGRPEDADRAYARAGELWRSLGNVYAVIRSLRARAWLDSASADDERELMSAAIHAGEEALASEDFDREALLSELGHTHRQFAQLLERRDDKEGAVQLERAAVAFDEAGDTERRDEARAALAR
ncbi:tetratricopeptide repeat protein [Streptomyces kunmingensis]|uniref:Tetratricopeptide repeat protein n=1 Tax=Streptomyces kunmingensis TaxID=68225 RepID=A0ABU6C8I7_9ACTN|nr:tetratricopeptide repeat protein [Streptomyces kunmingensis]MEB3960376.1 tetratricopeptide repeat protein [Streptomyces kunmingensis]